MALNIIGVGGPRTGTASLKDALEMLDFGKCYHMDWLFNNPDEVKYWIELFETGTTDFDSLFDGFASTVDFPGYMNYKILFEKYPDAKVILSARDADQWYESFLNTVYDVIPKTIWQKLGMMKNMIKSPALRKIAKVFMLVEKYILEVQYKGKFADREATIKIYNYFNEEVIKHIPAEQLLVYKISDGWAPLCEFLKVPVPEEDFPYKNKRKEFKEQINQMKATGKPLVLK
jgi:hypothetical protein